MKKICILLVGCLLTLGACNQSTPTSSQHNSTANNNNSPLLNPTDFQALLAKTPDRQLLDIRTPEECAKGVLEGAAMLNFYEKDFKDKVATLDKAKPTFIYCARGGRSSEAFALMKQIGFTNLCELKGGYTAWTSDGLKTAMPTTPK
jgi:rhodanese-related sulfurtransferase